LNLRREPTFLSSTKVSANVHTGNREVLDYMKIGYSYLPSATVEINL
jgi:hypothetical protein